MRKRTATGPVQDKEYKLFLVETDDEDRERVIVGRVKCFTVDVEPEWIDIHSGYVDEPIHSFKGSQKATATMDLVPNGDGTLFRIEDFTQEDEE